MSLCLGLAVGLPPGVFEPEAQRSPALIQAEFSHIAAIRGRYQTAVLGFLQSSPFLLLKPSFHNRAHLWPSQSSSSSWFCTLHSTIEVPCHFVCQGVYLS
ncbi:hypothetical protein WJX77_006329 [Trebouxia sp. C0004]